MYKFTYIIFLFCFAASLAGQVRKDKPRMIFVRNSESLSFDAEKHNAKVLKGNVICEHDGALLYCDSALIYEDQNRMVATGHILITKGDSIRVTGDKLIYDGKTRIATLENNVKCIEKDMTLTTNLLTFDVGRSIANYYNGGTIVNKENTLVSRNGHYYSSTKEAAFHYDVVLTNPDYTMKSDTLLYRITNKTTYFLGPSIITGKSDYIYCENGWYDTEKEKAQFSKNAILVTAQQKLKGDSLIYDRTNKTGMAFRNVVLTDTSHKSLIFGDYIQYREFKSEAFVTKKAIYARLLEDDTLFIAADTLYHTDIDSLNKFVNAYHHVRIYKKDVQAICDSATMVTKDSLLHLYYTPVLWSNKMQATSRVISVDIGKNSIKGFQLDGKAFLIQQVDTLQNADKFNQMSGRTIKGLISQDTIRKVTVTGNAEMLYFPKNKNNVIGLNRTNCSEINIWFKDGEIGRAKLFPATTGKVDPVKDVDMENAKLKGFSWLYDKRPARFSLHHQK